MDFTVDTPAAMEALGARIAAAAAGIDGALVYLRGELGAGKTTLVRGVLRGFGHKGAVKSPTYTLVESYAPGGRDIHHFDLYRLTDGAELEHIGLRDYLDSCALCLVEWPERGADVLPPADLDICIDYTLAGRYIRFRAGNSVGKRLLARL